MCKSKIGLTLGFFLAGIHLIWVFLVALVPVQLQSFIDWVFRLHGLEPVWTITFVTMWGAISLVILTFIVGYAIGWVLSWLAEYCDCCKTAKKRR